MGQARLVGPALPNIPWEDRPQGCSDVIWRSRRNPIITRDAAAKANSIFNSAVVPFDGGFAGVFRVDTTARNMELRTGKSHDGITWAIEESRIEFVCDDPEVGKFVYGYDPRVTWLEDRYYVTWCNWYHGPTIGLGYTFDFRTFYQMENAFLPFNRNGVLFPRRIRGKYAMLSRPSDPGHTPFGDIFYSESPDLTHWGKHRHVMSPVPNSWQSTKVGAGPVPVETTEGWLLFYHGVLTSCNGFVYSFGAAILDLDEPWKVIYRTRPYLLSPREPYECVGDVPNVVFPTAVLCDPPTGRMAIYYGGADTVTCIAFAYFAELFEFVKENSL
ncbi:MAG: glycoside hydrolase family 130 protein [Candidatus Bipolaricaulota bacterium]|nr:glycoside hydrolase family 130 protein [Candidatus Bipolaricaulota bacterium]MDW8126471.1 glycoside hydrolase family 130 protein [Candidatus Bipolaricaulota bacterium]